MDPCFKAGGVDSWLPSVIAAGDVRASLRGETDLIGTRGGGGPSVRVELLTEPVTDSGPGSLPDVVGPGEVVTAAGPVVTAAGPVVTAAGFSPCASFM